MRIPSLKKIKTDDLDLLYIDAIRQWAKTPAETQNADLAVAVADELERRGKPVPTEEVKAETDLIFSIAIASAQELQTRVRRN